MGIWTILGIIAALLLLVFGIYALLSPGKPGPLLDERGKPVEGALSEKLYIPIGGIRQGVFIRSSDLSKPVLLVLHGGPCVPLFPMLEGKTYIFESDFTVCYWEERGTGMSYSAKAPRETLTVEQLVRDAVELTNYLRERFGKDKIYIAGYSWGSLIGIKAAAREPDLYQAYIGIGQITCQLESEKLSLEYMTEKLRNSGDEKTIKKLYKLRGTTDNLSPAYISIRNVVLHNLGVGTTRGMRRAIWNLFWMVTFSRIYTIKEKTNIGRAVMTNLYVFTEQLYKIDLRKEVPRLDVPAFFMSGVYDYYVSYTLAKAYAEMLDAPSKRFYTFDDSAHCPILEESDKFLRILKEDVLALEREPSPRTCEAVSL